VSVRVRLHCKDCHAAPGLVERLEAIRSLIATLPIATFGEGVGAMTLPSGEAGEMRWPIRDEIVDDLTKAAAALRAASAEPSGVPVASLAALRAAKGASSTPRLTAAERRQAADDLAADALGR
jgi:hypothetical protein